MSDSLPRLPPCRPSVAVDIEHHAVGPGAASGTPSPRGRRRPARTRPGPRLVGDHETATRGRVVALDHTLHRALLRTAPRGRCRVDDLAGLDARRAPYGGSVPADDALDPLDVRVPAPMRAPVRVRHAHPEARALPADLTYCCHGPLPSGPPTVAVPGPVVVTRGRCRIHYACLNLASHRPKMLSHATSGFVLLTSGRRCAGAGIGSWHGGHRPDRSVLRDPACPHWARRPRCRREPARHL